MKKPVNFYTHGQFYTPSFGTPTPTAQEVAEYHRINAARDAYALSVLPALLAEAGTALTRSAANRPAHLLGDIVLHAVNVQAAAKMSAVEQAITAKNAFRFLVELHDGNEDGTPSKYSKYAEYEAAAENGTVAFWAESAARDAQAEKATNTAPQAAEAYHIQEVGTGTKTFTTGLVQSVDFLLTLRKEGEATNKQYILLDLDGYIVPSSAWPAHLR